MRKALRRIAASLISFFLSFRVFVILTAVLAATPAFADGGVYSQTRHGDPNMGVYRDASIPRGNCSQCHSQHGGASGMNEFGLFAPNYGGNRNGLCYTSGCHSGAGTVGIYQGQGYYSVSTHGTSGSCYWPGPNPQGRPNSDAGNCLNCHNPHGVKDSTGLVPSMAVAREESLCITCHDSSGPALKNIGTQIAKAYDHSIDNTTLSGRHAADETMTPASYSGTNRHVECADCHNVHRIASGTTHTVGTNQASDALKGVSWVQVANDMWPAAGGRPNLTAHSADDTFTIRYEYELCFKCHSNWSYGLNPPYAPSGGIETDQSVEFNPNNASYHPVTGPIKNNSYTRPSSVNGFTETMAGEWAMVGDQHVTMHCSDCHGDDTSNSPKGPHGSSKPYVLIASTSETDNTLCLKCHSESVYAPSTNPRTDETGSRFDQQTSAKNSASHYNHVITRRVGCRQCHGGRYTLGSGSSPIQPGSIHGTNAAPGFMNGSRMSAYSPGSCTPTCHGTKTYTAGPE